MPEEPPELEYESVTEVLAEKTGRPESDFEYTGEVPDVSEQEWIGVTEDNQ